MKNIIIKAVSAMSLFLLVINFTTGQRTNYKVNVIAPNYVKLIKPSFENVSIYRLQLRIKTGSMKHAGTNSPVYTVMNEDEGAYTLNLSKDDREKGQTDVYDIMSTSIKKIKDIDKLVIANRGDDAWNVQQVEVLVNNVVIFKRTFRGRQAWIEGRSKKYKSRIELNRTQLRNSSMWGYNSTTKNIYKAPKTLPVKMIKSQIESLVGNAMRYTDSFTWGKRNGKEYVSIKKVDDFTLHVDLDLKQRGFMNLKDSETDVDFHIKFRYYNGKLRTEIKNLDIDFSDYGHLSTMKRDLRHKLLGQSKKRNWIENIGLLQLDNIYNIDFTYSKTTTATNTCGNGIMVLENGNVCLGNNKGISERRKKIN